MHKSCGDVNLSAKINFVDDAVVRELAVWRLEVVTMSDNLLSKVTVLVHEHGEIAVFDHTVGPILEQAVIYKLRWVDEINAF